MRPLPNGNVLLVAWHYVSKQDAIAAGRHPESISDEGIWPDKVVEVKQTGGRNQRGAGVLDEFGNAKHK